MACLRLSGLVYVAACWLFVDVCLLVYELVGLLVCSDLLLFAGSGNYLFGLTDFVVVSCLA